MSGLSITIAGISGVNQLSAMGMALKDLFTTLAVAEQMDLNEAGKPAANEEAFTPSVSPIFGVPAPIKTVEVQKTEAATLPEPVSGTPAAPQPVEAVEAKQTRTRRTKAQMAADAAAAAGDPPPVIEPSAPASSADIFGLEPKFPPVAPVAAVTATETVTPGVNDEKPVVLNDLMAYVTAWSERDGNAIAATQPVLQQMGIARFSAIKDDSAKLAEALALLKAVGKPDGVEAAIAGASA